MTTTRNLTIPANPEHGYWTDTGLHIHVGDEVMIEANPEEQWWLGERWPGGVDADGHGFEVNYERYEEGTQPGGLVRGARHGTLVGQIGQGLDIRRPLGAFPVGLGHRFVARQEGTLYLTCNDDFFADNEGSIDVRIAVETAPHPGRLLDTVQTERRRVHLLLADLGEHDGDSVVIFSNGRPVLGHESAPHLLNHGILRLPIELSPGRNTLRIVAKGTDMEGVCTGRFRLMAGREILVGMPFQGHTDDAFLVDIDTPIPQA